LLSEERESLKELKEAASRAKEVARKDIGVHDIFCIV
jgi:hypothetical protein